MIEEIQTYLTGILDSDAKILTATDCTASEIFGGGSCPKANFGASNYRVLVCENDDSLNEELLNSVCVSKDRQLSIYFTGSQTQYVTLKRSLQGYRFDEIETDGITPITILNVVSYEGRFLSKQDDVKGTIEAELKYKVTTY